MSASRVPRRTSGKQLQFDGPWVWGCSPATAAPGHATTTSSLLSRPSESRRPMLRNPDATRYLSQTFNLPMLIFIQQKSF